MWMTAITVTKSRSIVLRQSLVGLMEKLSGNIVRSHAVGVMVTIPVMKDLTAQVTILGIYNLLLYYSYHGYHGYHGYYGHHSYRCNRCDSTVDDN